MEKQKNVDSEPRNYKVLPLTLALDTVGGIAEPVVLRGTTLPVKRTRTFSTAEDDQAQVEIALFCGERPIAKKNFKIEDVIVDNLPAGKHGTVTIRVSIEVTRTCLIRLSASVDGTQIRKNVEIRALERYLTDEVVLKHLSQAKASENQDAISLKFIEIKNRAKTTIASAEAYLQQNYVFGENKGIEKLIAELGLALDDGDNALYPVPWRLYFGESIMESR